MTAGAAFAAKPRRIEHRLAREKLGNLIPRQIGPWTASGANGIIVTSEEASQTDGYDQLLTRIYEAENLPAIMLLVAYGGSQGGSLQLHRPETCYPAQGFKLSDFSDQDLDLGLGPPIPTRRFTARRDERVERLMYWTRIGTQFPQNTAQEYLAILASVLRGLVPDGVLVRVSSIGADVPRSDATISAFAGQMMNLANAQGKATLANVT